MYELQSKNVTQLKKELKPYEGKMILKLTRINSLKDGEFIKILHKVKSNELVFWDGEQLNYLEINKDIEIMNNGFRFKNCTYEILDIKQ